jgi:hypothetical protein
MHAVLPQPVALLGKPVVGSHNLYELHACTTAAAASLFLQEPPGVQQVSAKLSHDLHKVQTNSAASLFLQEPSGVQQV